MFRRLIAEELQPRWCLTLDTSLLTETASDSSALQAVGEVEDQPVAERFEKLQSLSADRIPSEHFQSLRTVPTSPFFFEHVDTHSSITEESVDEVLRTLTSTGSKDDLLYLDSEDGLETDGDIWPQLAQSTPLINLDDFRGDARFFGIDGSGFSSVIIDSGIDLDHPFFGPDMNGNGVADRIVYSYDFYGSDDANASDFHGHGSNVSSIVASSDSTYRGMAPGAGIIHLKVFPDASGEGASIADIEQALQWVVANAATYNIASVNLSLGAGNYQTYQANAWFDEFAALAKLNVIPVAATGNSFYSVSSVEGISVPAADPNVIAVGAVYDANIGGVSYASGASAFTTAADRIAPFTQRHPLLMDILAPGAPITGANQSGGTVTMHGTSQASPHISGIAVLAQDLAVQELGRRLTVEEFRALLRSTAVMLNDGDDENDNVDNTGRTFPRVDVLALGNAVMALKPGQIGGLVFNDQNGDGTKTGDPGLAGWTVYLDADNNGSRSISFGSHSSTDVPKSIDDYQVLRSTLAVANVPGVITDVNLQLNITHTFDADIWAYLISPSGDRVKLFSGVGGGGGNFTNTILDDEASSAIGSNTAPFTGTYRPESLLSNFDGENPNGNWILEIGDLGFGGTGSITSWSVQIAYSEVAVTTDGTGMFSFTGLVPGPYTVREEVQSGNQLTTPANGFRTVVVTPGQVVTNVDFGNFDTSTLPRVQGIHLRGSGWSSGYLDLLAANGLGTAAGGYRLLDGGNQIANAGLITWTAITQISATFSKDVTVANGGFRLLNSSNQDLTLATTGGFSYDPVTHTAKWTLAAPLTRDKFLIVLDASKIVNSQGVALDGEWTTSSSTYASSGNGTAGGNLYFRFNSLPGDVNLSGTTNLSDVSIIRGTGTAIATSGNFRHDLNGSNVVNISDVTEARLQGIGTLFFLPDPTIPPSPPSGSPRQALSASAVVVFRDDISARSAKFESPTPDEHIDLGNHTDRVSPVLAAKHLAATMPAPLMNDEKRHERHRQAAPGERRLLPGEDFGEEAAPARLPSTALAECALLTAEVYKRPFELLTVEFSG